MASLRFRRSRHYSRFNTRGAHGAGRSAFLGPGSAPAFGRDKLASEDGARAIGITGLAGVEVAVAAKRLRILAIGGLGGVGLVLQRYRRRIGLADHVDCLGASA